MGGQPDEHVTTTDESGRNVTTGRTTGTTTGTTTGMTNVALPPWLRNFIPGLVGEQRRGIAGLTDAVNDWRVPQATTDYLTGAAEGDYLYGGAGMDAFVDAATRKAMPGIISTFGGAGRGTGGLAQAAVGQAAIDAYAGQYANERGLQQAAALALPGITAMPVEMQRGLLSALTAIPGSWAPFLGGETRGTTDGTTRGMTTQRGTTSSTGTQTQPVYEDPWWTQALGAGAMLASIPLTGGASLGAGAAAGAAGPTIAGRFLSGLGFR